MLDGKYMRVNRLPAENSTCVKFRGTQSLTYVGEYLYVECGCVIVRNTGGGDDFGDPYYDYPLFTPLPKVIPKLATQ